MRSQLPSGDAIVLRAALEVEQVASFAYEHVRSSQPESAPLLGTLAAQDREHARILGIAVRSLGATPPQPPADVKAAEKGLAALHLSRSIADVRTENGALDFLIELEAAAEGVYFLAIPKLSDSRLVRAAAQIMANEAQHVALLRLLRHPRDPARAVPTAFVEGKH
jgi:rubrerythrin